MKDLDKHIICKFPYGSFTYGIKPTEYSDIDIVAIVDDSVDFSAYYNEIYEEKIPKDDNYNMEVDTQYIKESNFIEMVKNHHIIALESMWLPKEMIISGTYDYEKYFEFDKWKLRQTISSIVSNAWAKCHKKLTVEKDYDFYRAIKSLFHCLRLLEFGIQIATYGKLVDYTVANHYWEDLWDKDIIPSHKWEDYKAMYQPQINALRSEFVKLCPKPIN